MAHGSEKDALTIASGSATDPALHTSLISPVFDGRKATNRLQINAKPEQDPYGILPMRRALHSLIVYLSAAL